jgi:hypothetical protein
MVSKIVVNAEEKSHKVTNWYSLNPKEIWIFQDVGGTRFIKNAVLKEVVYKLGKNHMLLNEKDLA